MLELNMMTKKAVAAADNVVVPLCSYLHMYNTAYARRNVRQRAQLILQRVLYGSLRQRHCHSHSHPYCEPKHCGHHAAAAGYN